MMRILSCLILIIISVNLNSQNYKRDQERFLDAEYFLMFGDYSDALPTYLSLYKEYSDNYNLTYRIGLCYLNISGQKNKAIEYLELASRNSSAIYKEGSLKQLAAPYTAWFFLANAYRINYQFEKAADAYLKYRETLMEDDTDNIMFIDHQIEVCKNARDIMVRPVNYSEENIGEMVNDNNSNFNPVISSDGNIMLWMTSLKFYDAVFYRYREKGKWSSPINITPDIQSDGDLYISCLANNGNTLYLSKDDDNDSDLYYSTFNGTSWSVATALDKNINTRYWESHAFASNDGNTLIFASDRPGGIGGLDLYICQKGTDGAWSEPVNMGPEINTPFNEERPFLVDGGKQLFFSSQGHYNMGGFDLFRSHLLQNGKWSRPENLGYPLNTPDDEVFFMPLDDGSGGYISLHKEGSGYGKEDIYLIKFK